MYYKYLPIERLTYLEDQYLRFTPPGDLNDPFECLPQKPSKLEIQELVLTVAKRLVGSVDVKAMGNNKFLEIIEKHLQDIEKNVEANLLERYYSAAQSSTNAKVGILSLSKNWNSTLMWSHYTEAHRGFCVGFDNEHIFFNDEISNDGEKSKFTKEVKYSTDRVKVPMTIGLPKLGFEPFITKSIHWNYEEEIRVLQTFSLSPKIIDTTPFPINLFVVPHDAISEIILGANISDDSASLILDFSRQRGIKCFKSKISDLKYDMEREETYL